MDSLKKIFSSISRPKKVIVIEHKWPKRERDWKIIILSFFFLVLLSAALSALLFSGISRGEFFLTVKKTNDGGDILNRDLLDQTIEFYENRARNLDDIKNRPKQFANPAL